MSDLVFTVVLPAYWVLAAVGVLANRARVRREAGVDPIVFRPYRRVDTPHGFLEATLSLVAGVVTLDILLNALASEFVARYLTIPALRGFPPLGWAGLAAVTAGILLSTTAVLHMGTSWRMGIDRQTAGGLVTGGLYRRLRHPIYSGMLLITVGLAALTADVVSVAVAASAVVALHLQARLEEEFLLARHGGEYAAYKAATGRFWPKRRAAR
jgi:protein-S-isoprenylcysteine O-methyltransferase Ste14